jgi:hypothetical protein
VQPAGRTVRANWIYCALIPSALQSASPTQMSLKPDDEISVKGPPSLQLIFAVCSSPPPAEIPPPLSLTTGAPM